MTSKKINGTPSAKRPAKARTTAPAPKIEPPVSSVNLSDFHIARFDLSGWEVLAGQISLVAFGYIFGWLTHL